MSKAGYHYDNSPMESFFASLKKEYFLRKEYATIKDVENDLFYYIEIFYNRKRLHSSLNRCFEADRIKYCIKGD